MERERDERIRQVIAAAVILGGVLVITILMRFSSGFPGLLGEWLGTLTGFFSTPFLLEATFLTLGFLIVLVLNHWRLKRDGDEFVYLEQVAGPEVPGNLPESAKFAVYREAPLAGENPPLLAQAEGAAAIGDWDSVAELLGSMNEAELHLPATRPLRIALAEATGHDELARRLKENA